MSQHRQVAGAELRGHRAPLPIILSEVRADGTEPRYAYGPDGVAAQLVRARACGPAATMPLIGCSAPAMRARKQAFYEEEQAMVATLCEIWRQPQRRPTLRMVAMACIGVVRLSLEVWSQQDTTNQALADVLQEGFASLKLAIQ